MFPDNAFASNIGIHATVLNKADHYRRLHYNPLLAYNMYSRCNVLYGKHPAKIRGIKLPSTIDYLHSVGGIGWLSENFARAVALYQLNPKDHTFYPFIAGYCWNVASALMFHLYSLLQGNCSGRKNALFFFKNIPEIKNNKILNSSAELLYEYRECTDDKMAFAKPLIDATGYVLNYVKNQLFKKINIDLICNKQFFMSSKIFNEAILYETSFKKLFGTNSTHHIIDALRDERLDYFDSISEIINKIKLHIGKDISPKENFEFVRDALSVKSNLSKIRIWDSVSYFRYSLSHDYFISRGISSESGVFFGWEDGIQSLLQRLNEIYIEKSGIIDSEVECLTNFSIILAEERLNLLGIDINKNQLSKIKNVRSLLAEVLVNYCDDGNNLFYS